mgnify:CR=1 FL=1
MLELPACHENPTHQLLPMWVPLLGLNKHLADVINRPLNRIFLSGLLALHNNSYTNSRALAATYSNKGSLSTGAAMICGSANCRFKLSKASLAASL